MEKIKKIELTEEQKVKQFSAIVGGVICSGLGYWSLNKYMTGLFAGWEVIAYLIFMFIVGSGFTARFMKEEETRKLLNERLKGIK